MFYILCIQKCIYLYACGFWYGCIASKQGHFYISLALLAALYGSY